MNLNLKIFEVPVSGMKAPFYNPFELRPDYGEF